tara:strand:- start:258 stop:722 length:465 start_codon:yes stop_codon:yes gene_type:complete
MKIKLNFILNSILYLFLLSNCGYQPLYSSKSQEFSFGKIEIYGDKDLVKFFGDQMKRFQNDTENSYNLIVNVDNSVNAISKDKKGNPSIYSLSISTKIDFFKEDELHKTNTFYESSTYNNMENKFDLKRYEQRLEKKLLNNIVEDIIIYTQNMQ